MMRGNMQVSLYCDRANPFTLNQEWFNIFQAEAFIPEFKAATKMMVKAPSTGDVQISKTKENTKLEPLCLKKSARPEFLQ